MKILMVTNTYAPHVGGVARSVTGFSETYREMGHDVVVVAPRFEGTPPDEPDVIRFPALRRLSGSDFSVPLPVPWRIRWALRRFAPDLVHSHHPFLLGDTALRVSALQGIPIVFTHHTMYEEYTHYVPGDSPALKRFAIELVTGYCNLCDAVVAPSETVRDVLVSREVTAPIEVIPTGVDLDYFASGRREVFRDELGISDDEFVIGHVGRLAPEKNLGFLARAVARYLRDRADCHFVIAGAGPSSDEIRTVLDQAGCAGRLHLLGLLDRDRLADCYAAMDLFAFASQTETQGMVITEAMASGLPVVAVDASGVREVVKDGVNGRLLQREDEAEFGAAIDWCRSLTSEELKDLRGGILETARAFSMGATARRAIQLYEKLRGSEPAKRRVDESPWASTQRRFSKEMQILGNIASAFADSMNTRRRTP
jgi:1,2-diacylglycerol 3-alpha-glucosyltransferase